MSLGIGLCQVVALGVQGGDGQQGSHNGNPSDAQDPEALLKGYRASFWTIFGYMALCVVTAVFGLRKVGKVGIKRD